MLSLSLQNYLGRWIGSSSSESPLLLVGPPETTAKTARFVAQTILCEAQGALACTVCIACRQTEKSLHPDFVEFTSDIPHTIALVRSLEERLAQRPLHGTHVIVLHSLEQLSLVASQALLKTLEEPRASTRFILTSAFPRRLLSTILSRCTRFALEQTATAEYVAELNLEDVNSIEHFLTKALQHKGPSASLRRAFFRLRDYYKITALKGNSKLAKEILVASLQELRYV